MAHYPPRLIESLPSSVSVLKEAAYYLIKLYTHDNESLFGKVSDGHIELNGMGQIAADEWVRSSHAYRGIELDQWLILPDHLEGIVCIREPLSSRGYAGQSNKPRLLSSFVASYKAAAAKRINLLRNAPGSSVWQRSYQERLIPDEAVLSRVRHLILKQIES